MTRTAATKKGRSLLEFDRAKRREACAVCALPEGLREQLRSARDRKIGHVRILEWLREDYAITLKREDFVSHGSAHHDAWQEEGQ